VLDQFEKTKKLYDKEVSGCDYFDQELWCQSIFDQPKTKSWHFIISSQREIHNQKNYSNFTRLHSLFSRKATRFFCTSSKISWKALLLNGRGYSSNMCIRIPVCTVRLKNKLYVFKTKLQQNRNEIKTKQQQNQNFGQTKSWFCCVFVLILLLFCFNFVAILFWKTYNLFLTRTVPILYPKNHLIKIRLWLNTKKNFELRACLMAEFINQN